MSRAISPTPDPISPPTAPVTPGIGLTLRQLAIRATGWTIFATYGGQAIRLASNLILTRLLFPEAFGLMGVTYLVLHGLNLFSDVGIQQSLIQDPRADERWFNNTAWTLQVVRGVMLWLASCAAAVGLYYAGGAGLLPADTAFADPRLVWLLPAVGLTSIASGFNSTKVITLRRRMTLGYDAAFQLATQCVSIAIIITWAWFAPSVWALAWGSVIGTFIGSVASHVMLPGEGNRFAWNPIAAGHLIRFGRFIFISTIFTFIAHSAQRAMLGSVMTVEMFGVYGIAVALATIISSTLDRIHQNVLFPLYSQLARRNDPAALSRNVRRVRLRLLAMTLPPMWLLAIFGKLIIQWMYDDRYQAAGWMLQLLSIAVIPLLISLTVKPIMLAHGDSKQNLIVTALSTILLLACMALGFYAGGAPGVLIGAAISELLQHIVVLVYVRRYGVSTPRLDLGLIALSALVIGIGWTLWPL